MHQMMNGRWQMIGTSQCCPFWVSILCQGLSLSAPLHDNENWLGLRYQIVPIFRRKPCQRYVGWHGILPFVLTDLLRRVLVPHYAARVYLLPVQWSQVEATLFVGKDESNVALGMSEALSDVVGVPGSKIPASCYHPQNESYLKERTARRHLLHRASLQLHL